MDEPLSERTTKESLIAYLGQRFPGRDVEPSPGYFDTPSGKQIIRKLKTLRDVERLLDRTEKGRERFRDLIDRRSGGVQPHSGGQELMRAVVIVDPRFRAKYVSQRSFLRLLEELDNEMDTGPKDQIDSNEND